MRPEAEQNEAKSRGDHAARQATVATRSDLKTEGPPIEVPPVVTDPVVVVDGSSPDERLPESGWYYHQGDPEGTTRYWNGESWQGEPTLHLTDTAGGYTLIDQPEPVAPGDYGAYTVRSKTALATPVRTSTLPPKARRKRQRPWERGLTILALLVTLAKAVPLAALFFLMRWYDDVGPAEGRRRLAEELGVENRGLLDDLEPYFVPIMVVGIALLLAQAIGAIFRVPTLLFASAGALVLVDVYTLFERIGIGASLVANAVALALQAWIAWWAIRFAD